MKGPRTPRPPSPKRRIMGQWSRQRWTASGRRGKREEEAIGEADGGIKRRKRRFGQMPKASLTQFCIVLKMHLCLNLLFHSKPLLLAQFICLQMIFSRLPRRPPSLPRRRGPATWSAASATARPSRSTTCRRTGSRAALRRRRAALRRRRPALRRRRQSRPEMLQDLQHFAGSTGRKEKLCRTGQGRRSSRAAQEAERKTAPPLACLFNFSSEFHNG